jgi:hypothetical protein
MSHDIRDSSTYRWIREINFGNEVLDKIKAFMLSKLAGCSDMPISSPSPPEAEEVSS